MFLSEEYKRQLVEMHATTGWGAGGHKWAFSVCQLIGDYEAKTLLDYGCGKGTLRPAVEEYVEVREYDPGVPGKDATPAPADLVICTDVLEHIEPEHLEAVMRHIFDLTLKAAFFVIVKVPAGKCLPDGRNTHLITEQTPFWLDAFKRAGWPYIDVERDDEKYLMLFTDKI